MDKSKERDVSYFSNAAMFYNVMLLSASIILWAMAVHWYPSIDGVAVYELSHTLPDKSVFTKSEIKTSADEVFSAEASLLNYCIFPAVYSDLVNKPAAGVLTTLSIHGLGPEPAAAAQGLWVKMDFSILHKPGTEYNLPYDLVATTEKPGINSQYYPPVCRCLNKAFGTYGAKPRTTGRTEFAEAQTAIDNCLATRHLIKRQTLIGNTNYKNGDMNARKYISRHAMLFQLCFAFAIGAFYNRIDFLSSKFWEGNLMHYIGLFVVFVLLWLGNVISSGSVGNGIFFASIVILPTFVVAIPVEFMWSFVAKTMDIGRQTYMHPLSFYVVISALYTIALIENGVFTLSVIVTHIFQSNVMSMAYAGALFVSHGKIWERSSSRTGYVLILFLSATMHIFHHVPLYPVNCELNFLWILPAAFSVVCFAKILFMDYMMNHDTTQHKLYRVTHSDHLLNIGHVLIIALAVLYYIIQLANLRYGEGEFMGASGGRLTKRLNFEFAEMGASAPLYDTLRQTSFSDRFYVNP
jgi:hypothetical protein